METIIKIEREDILTSRIGNNVKVQIDEKISLIFTPEAIDELYADYSMIKPELDSDRDNVKYMEFAPPTMEELGQLRIEFPIEQLGKLGIDAEETMKQALRDEIKNVEY